jgi:hypothetical protein
MSDDEQAKPEAPETDRKNSGDRRKRLVGAGVAVGIGSAAIVAALLYTKGSRRTGE